MNIISIRIPDLPIPAVNCNLTFGPYLRYVEEQLAETKSETYKNFLSVIADKIKTYPELLKPITDYSLLDKHTELIELIKITHLSQAKGDQKMFALGIPSGSPTRMNYFAYSDEFAKFHEEMNGRIRISSKEVGEEFHRGVYREVIKNGYGVCFDHVAEQPMLQWTYDSGSVRHYYKVTRRLQFAAVTVDGSLPEPRQEWIDYASGVIATHAELTQPLPFEKFIIEGFFIFSIEEETEEVALKELSKIITHLHANDAEPIVDKMRQATLSLLGDESIEVGFLAMLKVNGNYVYHNLFSHTSLIFSRLKNHFTEKELADVYHCISEQSLDNVSLLDSLNNDLHCMMEDEAEMAEKMKMVIENSGLRSMKFVPVWHNNILLGIVELGSSQEKAINVNVLRKLDPAIPLFREFFLVKTGGFENYMKSFIMERYTSIQNSVAWKLMKKSGMHSGIPKDQEKKSVHLLCVLRISIRFTELLIFETPPRSSWKRFTRIMQRNCIILKTLLKNMIWQMMIGNLQTF